MKDLKTCSGIDIQQKTIHFLQLHLHNRVQSRLAFPQEQELQLPLHEHLTNSLVHFPTSGMVIRPGFWVPRAV